MSQHSWRAALPISLRDVAAGLLLACLSPQRADAADPTPPGWQTYINTKYDFDICYPATLIAAPETGADDGRIFTGPAGGTLKVFWRPGTAGDTLAHTADAEAAVNAAATVTYTANRSNWAVRSGRAADQIFYVKVIQRDSDYLVMHVTYPDTAAPTWNGMVGHFAACFESSRPR